VPSWPFVPEILADLPHVTPSSFRPLGLQLSSARNGATQSRSTQPLPPLAEALQACSSLVQLPWPISRSLQSLHDSRELRTIINLLPFNLACSSGDSGHHCPSKPPTISILLVGRFPSFWFCCSGEDFCRSGSQFVAQEISPYPFGRV
jgi:hypothetical protein